MALVGFVGTFHTFASRIWVNPTPVVMWKSLNKRLTSLYSCLLKKAVCWCRFPVFDNTTGPAVLSVSFPPGYPETDILRPSIVHVHLTRLRGLHLARLRGLHLYSGTSWIDRYWPSFTFCNSCTSHRKYGFLKSFSEVEIGQSLCLIAIVQA